MEPARKAGWLSQVCQHMFPRDWRPIVALWKWVKLHKTYAGNEKAQRTAAFEEDKRRKLRHLPRPHSSSDSASSPSVPISDTPVSASRETVPSQGTYRIFVVEKRTYARFDLEHKQTSWTTLYMPLSGARSITQNRLPTVISEEVPTV